MPLSASAKAYMRAYHWSHKEEHSERTRRSKLKVLYGITPKQWEELFIKQNGLCAVCGNWLSPSWLRPTKQTNVDHDHRTGKVRGLLCVRCNNGLGQFLDQGVLLIMAHKYLETHYA